MSTSWTAGVVRHGMSDPAPYVVVMTIVERDERCAELGHPGVTYNNFPSVDRTWCVCGKVTYPGNQAQHGVACCGGPLDRTKRIEGEKQ